MTFKKTLEKIESFLEKIENIKIGFFSWLLCFLCFIFLRNFLEAFSSASNFTLVKSWPFFFLHSVIFYFFTFLSFILVGYLLTKEKIEKIAKASLFLMPFILLPPIFDLISSESAEKMTNLYSFYNFSGFFDVVVYFFKYVLFGPFGIFNFGDKLLLANHFFFFKDFYAGYYGIKLELILVIWIFLIYVFLKTRRIRNVLAGLFFSFLIVFVIGHFPSFFTSSLGLFASSKSFHSVSLINPDFSWNYIMFSLYFVSLIPLSLAYSYFYNKEKLIAIFKNIRFFRMGLYLCAFYVGIFLARRSFNFNFFDWLLIIMANLAIIFSWLFAVGSNDLADEKTDIISNPERPLPSGKLVRSEVSSLNLIFRILSYICAIVAGYTFFITILVRSCISYLYSNEPFRLKRFPLISTFCIASSVLLGIMGGYLLFVDNSIYSFPNSLSWLVLLVFTLSLNVIHVKDYAGDKKERIWTIPVIFGLEKGKRIVGALSAISFLIPPLIFYQLFNYLILPSIFCAISAYFLITSKNYKEWLVLALYYIYTIPVSLLIIKFL